MRQKGMLFTCLLRKPVLAKFVENKQTNKMETVFESSS